VARSNPSFQKRQLERKKTEKREAKAREKEDRRRRLEEDRARAVAEGEDPDLAGIVAGPQPTEDGTEEDDEDEG
jgi:hypothetical protein